MKQRVSGPTYMERVVHVPPRAAAAAFDLALLDVGAGWADGNGRWVFEDERGSLALTVPAANLDAGILSGVYPLRRACGRLRSGPFRFAVELEIVAWSESATAVGLRPVGARPRRAGAMTYFAVGSAALDHVRKEIARWARADATVRALARC